MKNKEKVISENKELLKSFCNSMELNIWIISTFGMNAIKSPQNLQSIFDIMEKHGIKTFRNNEPTASISFSLDDFKSNLNSFETKTANNNNLNKTK